MRVDRKEKGLRAEPWNTPNIKRVVRQGGTSEEASEEVTRKVGGKSCEGHVQDTK